MRKEKKYNYIYKTTCSVTNRYYIGMHSTDKLDDGYMGSGKRLWFSINYHGKENHTKEILEFCENRAELKKREVEIVNEVLITEDLCMNLMTGGQGGFSSEEHRLKAQIAGAKAFHIKLESDLDFKESFCNKVSNGLKKAYKNGNRKPSKSFEGKKHSEETKDKMRKSKNVGENNSNYGNCWITDGINNKLIKRGDEIPSGWLLGRNM